MRHDRIILLKAFVFLFLVSVAAFFVVSTLQSACSGMVISASARPSDEASEHDGSYSPEMFEKFKGKLARSHIHRLRPDWELALDGEAFLEEEAGILYVTSTNGRVMALNAASGAILWSLDLGTWVSAPPKVAEGVVYIGATNHVLYALDTGTGTLLWYYPTQGEILAQPVVSEGRIFCCADNDSVYNLIYRLYALDARSGRLIWTYDTTSWTPSAPAAGDGAVYLGGYGRDVCALSGASGEKRWSFTAPNIVFSSPQLSGGELLFTCIDGSAYALDATSGELVWRSKLSGFLSLAPQNGDGVIYACSVNGVTALKRDKGERLWDFNQRNVLSCSAAENGERVYVFDDQGKVYVLDASSGEWGGLLLMPHGLTAAPLIAGEHIFAGSPDGSVRAYSIPGEDISD